jgi:molybdenum cofactor cytidylyltransferase
MGAPKALLTLNGMTFADGLIRAFAACDDVVIVLGYDADRIQAGISRPVRFVINPTPELGQLSSLQCGLEATANADAIFFTPVDYPAISQETVRLLLNHAGSFAMPRFEGRRGHPVLLNRQMASEISACNTSARDVIRAHDPIYVDVPDPGILEDVDDPAAYARLQECGR